MTATTWCPNTGIQFDETSMARNHEYCGRLNVLLSEPSVQKAIRRYVEGCSFWREGMQP